MFVRDWNQFFDDFEKNSVTREQVAAFAGDLSRDPNETFGPVIASCITPETVPDENGIETKPYLIFRLPEFKSLSSLTFIIRSRDEDTYYDYGRRGTFKYTWSWFDVELWRDAKGPKPDFCDVRLSGDSFERDPRKIVVKNKKYMVGSWLLQRNKNGNRVPCDYAVTWDADVLRLDDDDPEKWEGGPPQDGEMGEQWYKGGCISNGELIRDLRPGDELRVVMKARYRGFRWECLAEKCEVRGMWT